MSKRNIVLKLAYDGTRYNGWQRQGNTKQTIQEKVETMLSRLLDEKIEVTASGRTDAGVHAKGQIINFHTDSEMTLNQIQEKGNEFLPQDIVIMEAVERSERFHSRLSAGGKHYQYRIQNSPVRNVFEADYQYQIPQQLDLTAMKEAAAQFVGEHDFASFCGNKHMKKSTVRRIFDIRLTQKEKEVVIDFYGTGFLYFMVRILTGTLIEVGLHKRNPESMKEILETKNRENAGFTAPAQGLCLMGVWYDTQPLQ